MPNMRWLPVVLLLVAIAIAVIVARGLPESYDFEGPKIERAQTPVDDAVSAAQPKN